MRRRGVDAEFESCWDELGRAAAMREKVYVVGKLMDVVVMGREQRVLSVGKFRKR